MILDDPKAANIKKQTRTKLADLLLFFVGKNPYPIVKYVYWYGLCPNVSVKSADILL